VKWCPDIEQGDASLIKDYKIDISDLKLYIWAGIQVEMFSSPLYNNYDEKLDQDNTVMYRVADLLNEAGIENIDNIKNTGAIIFIDV